MTPGQRVIKQLKREQDAILRKALGVPEPVKPEPTRTTARKALRRTTPQEQALYDEVARLEATLATVRTDARALARRPPVVVRLDVVE